MLGPFATASRRTPHYHSPIVSLLSRRTPPAHRCPRRRRRQQQLQRVTEGTAMAPIEWAQWTLRLHVAWTSYMRNVRILNS